jgi:uncharacterized protein (TIGR02246 family)
MGGAHSDAASGEIDASEPAAIDRLIDAHLIAEEMGDPDAAVAGLAPDVRHEVFGRRPVEGRAAARDFYASLFAGTRFDSIQTRRRYRGPSFAVDDAIVDANPVSGGRIRWRLIHLFEFGGGLITRELAWSITGDIPDATETVASSPVEPLRPDRPISPGDMIRAFSTRLNAGDLEGVAELYAPDAIYVQRSGESHGSKEIRQALHRLLQLRPSMSGRPVRIMRTSDCALVFNRWSFRGVRADGTDVEHAGLSLLVLRQTEPDRWRILLDDPWGGDREL